MFEIEMNEMSREFLPIWQAAGEHLDAQVDGGIRSWLRAHPYPPVLEHLSFRLGNQLFFVRVEDADDQIAGPGSRRGLLAVAQGTNGHSCILPMRKRMLRSTWVADRPGWGLVDARSGRPVDPHALVTDERIEMTDWELHDMAVQVVREHLQQQGFELMSWQGNPEVDPSIWFIGKSGRPEWVVVRAALFPDEEPERPGHWEDIARGCSHLSAIGHFAPVGICGVDQLMDPDDTGRRPYRGHRLHAEFQGLE
jgi:hypothetical protein